MIALNQAQEILTETFDRAFLKAKGTKKQRVSMAAACCSRVPTDNAASIALLIWATEYCAKWKGPKA